jgi:hypothetical protein
MAIFHDNDSQYPITHKSYMFVLAAIPDVPGMPEAGIVAMAIDGVAMVLSHVCSLQSAVCWLLSVLCFLL